jgi:hypothetical protein
VSLRRNSLKEEKWPHEKRNLAKHKKERRRRRRREEGESTRKKKQCNKNLEETESIIGSLNSLQGCTPDIQTSRTQKESCLLQGMPALSEKERKNK